MTSTQTDQVQRHSFFGLIVNAMRSLGRHPNEKLLPVHSYEYPECSRFALHFSSDFWPAHPGRQSMNDDECSKYANCHQERHPVTPGPLKYVAHDSAMNKPPIAPPCPIPTTEPTPSRNMSESV